MHVFKIDGDFSSVEVYVEDLFAAGATGLEEKPGQVWAYFPAPCQLELPGEWAELPETDWLSQWKKGLFPVHCGTVVILAPWHPWVLGTPIFIEPGMGFGTGHHATTKMAVTELARRELSGRLVLDLGTGSGILALTAAKLGAQALGLDIDPAAIKEAQKNSEINQVRADFHLGSLEAGMGPFDLIVANLYAELHASLAPLYRKSLSPGGELILTGILSEREALVTKALQSEGFSPPARISEGEWVLLTTRSPGSNEFPSLGGVPEGRGGSEPGTTVR